jgi:hypothetical protein
MIIDLFSKRQKKLRGEMPDVYVYDVIPQSLKIQIIHILRDTLGNEDEFYRFSGNVTETYTELVNMLCREYGVFRLGNEVFQNRRDYINELFGFILRETDHEKVLDAVELAFHLINTITRKWNYQNRNKASEKADLAIGELNTRFQQHGVGYRFEEGEIIRIDSEMLHVEVVKPALALLHAPQFDGAQAEFLKAHEHYRHKRAKEALTECLKSLESTMKSICAKRNWTHDPNATSNSLIKILFQEKLIPDFWGNYFSGLRALLEGGVPTARNNLSGHGQGVEVVEVPLHLVAYVLHQTAATIVFLIKSEENFPQE